MSEQRHKSPFAKSDDKKFTSPFRELLSTNDASPPHKRNSIAVGDLYPSLLASSIGNKEKISNPNVNIFQVVVRLRTCSAKGFMHEGKVLTVGDALRSLVIGRDLNV